MRKGISVAGNLIVDVTYPIAGWPKQSELTTITGKTQRSIGGAVCNTISDLARLDPQLPLAALGLIGDDAEGRYILQELRRYPNIDLSQLHTGGETSYTAVMSDDLTKKRTFFHYRGSNAEFCAEHIDFSRVTSRIFHIGYILLLDALDQADAEYGTKMARLLHDAKKHGLETSIDVVSESSDRYQKLVWPALRYTDYCVINELEAQQTTGVQLRDEQENLLAEAVPQALRALLDSGVSRWAVIHCPEGGFGMTAEGEYVSLPSLHLPEGFIRGTVGAGDAFCAGVLLGAHDGLSLRDAIRQGICTAAASLSRPGGSEGVGSREQVMALEAAYGRPTTV